MNDTFRSALVLSVNLNRYAPKVASHIKFILTSLRVFRTFSSTISMGMKKKVKFGLNLGKELKIIRHKFGHICVGF